MTTTFRELPVNYSNSNADKYFKVDNIKILLKEINLRFITAKCFRWSEKKCLNKIH